MRAIRKYLPAVVTTLQQIHETTGDVEAFGIRQALLELPACIFFLSEVLDTMQRKAADFSKLKVLLQFTLDELKLLRQEKVISLN